MESFLFLVLALAPFLAPLVVAATASALAVRAHRREKGGGRRLPDAGSCALLAVLAAAIALGVYGVGVMSGFYILDPEQMCAAAGAPGDYVVTRTTLPVSAQCVTEKGVGTELVPDWVNPTVYGGITLGTLALGAAVFQGRRSTPH
ncbi:hypothetical protein [Streptomyces stelliscabiei]|uniref:Uncharacterized protein n=1 Tax=Streptomyces stelliscabiei TaxID=146820 RepID=A0A8I0TTN9_9ACTN|nr:hypothetical protein [Streptomyces stelliscabiei]MBE1597473.1 hypothetical protein [Streptomyces stelliscabiei]MDX2513601.1 hypothetical protein [Streptomyces stelliscabiei]